MRASEPRLPRITSASGFTLIELMMVVAVIAILAAIALPTYSDYVTRSRLSDALTMLSSWRVQLEQLYQDNRNYGTGVCGVAVPTSRHFTFSCALGGGGQTYTLTAQGSGDLNTFTYTLTESNVRATTATKWGDTSTTCWILKKGGSC
jgi:type IV pilus assembly protein PilE